MHEGAHVGTQCGLVLQKSMDNPIGVSSYELTRALPTELESSLPSIEQIERELAEVEHTKDENTREVAGR